MADNYFSELNNINVNGKTEKKNGLTYLSWAWAWGEIKKLHPDATYTIYEDAAGCFYHTDGRTAWVKTGVTVNGIEHIEYLPVMDYKNKSIPIDNITSFDVNKAIQRSLTKACARHGLGLYIYAGEDLPEEETKVEMKTEKPIDRGFKRYICSDCGEVIEDDVRKDGSLWPAEEIAEYTKAACDRVLCKACGMADMKKQREAFRESKA